ncbi:hypothetical protein [Reinekea sp. G2M2-21]|nr:hypothetical protein [Reinekea sp. G2M2-21]
MKIKHLNDAPQEQTQQGDENRHETESSQQTGIKEWHKKEA